MSDRLWSLDELVERNNGVGDMNGQYSIQFQDKHDPKKRMRETTFDDFSALYAFLRSFDAATSPEAIQVHLPSHASEVERQQVVSLGYQLN